MRLDSTTWRSFSSDPGAHRPGHAIPVPLALPASISRKSLERISLPNQLVRGECRLHRKTVTPGGLSALVAFSTSFVHASASRSVHACVVHEARSVSFPTTSAQLKCRTPTSPSPCRTPTQIDAERRTENGNDPVSSAMFRRIALPASRSCLRAPGGSRRVSRPRTGAVPEDRRGVHEAHSTAPAGSTHLDRAGRSSAGVRHRALRRSSSSGASSGHPASSPTRRTSTATTTALARVVRAREVLDDRHDRGGTRHRRARDRGRSDDRVARFIQGAARRADRSAHDDRRSRRVNCSRSANRSTTS